MDMSKRVPLPLSVGVLLALVCAACLLCASAALAVTGGPQWTVTDVSAPTDLVPGDESGQEFFNIIVENTGGEAASGTVTIGDSLPEGVTLDTAGAGGVAFGPHYNEEGKGSRPLDCKGASCAYTGVVQPQELLLVRIPVDIAPLAEQTVNNVVHVSGGSAPDAFQSTPVLISATPAKYGIAPGSASVALSDSQAGAHADLTSMIGYSTINGKGRDAGNQKEASLVLPPGFGGDLVDTPQCPVSKFSDEECPVATQVGLDTLFFEGGLGREVQSSPIYNLQPEPGDVAKLGFATLGGSAHIQADVTVLPDTYQLKTTFHNIDALLKQNFVSITIWGVPTSESHDDWRQGPRTGNHISGTFGASSSNARVPYLASPTSCSGEEALPATYSSVSWEEPEAKPSEAVSLLAPLSDCDRLGLESTFTAVPTTTSAYAPTGLNVELGVHQTNENAEGLAASALKKAVVTLPEGMTVNPSAGAGLGACTREEYEAEVLETPVGVGCPIESKLGTVHIKTPALNEEGTGSVYLATPYANPFSEVGHPGGSLLALYVIARFPVRGVVVKVAGKVMANPITGRLVTTFEGVPALKGPSLAGLPPVPFSLFTFQFHQGETSPLVTPPACGSYEVKAELVPWSEPSQILTDISPAFEITSNNLGGACPSGGVPPFNPKVISGTEHNTAGSYSPFYLRIVREDGEQELTKFTSIFPPGLTGNLSGIPFCPEADIEASRSVTGAQELEHPSCPAASEIGHTLVGAGVGSVLAEAPGKIYLAGAYHGSALSVVSITAAKVGPFDLGTVVIRFALSINPITAQVEINGANSDPIPHIIDGIVVHVRDIRAYISREKFILNPTTCDPSTISESITGAGADPANPADQMTVAASAPFQAADCSSLQFKPTFKVTTSGKTSRTNGASLTAKLAYPANAMGTQANIAQVKVDLPKQLPSRLTTLQKACTAATFEANPANCPSQSRVGFGKAITPILPVPLEGPAYFVSYGGAKFPELVIVLQGYGFTIDLHGETFINKAGITSSTFHEVPDEPVGSFELTLPEGPYSALAANGNLCDVTNTVIVKKKETIRVKGRRKSVTRKVTQTVAGTLQMPTLFVAQNGDTIKQNTPIEVTGCPKAAKSKKKAKAGASGGKRRR
jgi:uncharacterized repeat protein (TIGR01451 family)